MLVACPSCGSYEISANVYEELEVLREPHWQIDLIREGLKSTSPPVKTARTSTNIFEVRSLEEKLTKLQKKLRRKKAKEGPTEAAGQIYYVGEDDK